MCASILILESNAEVRQTLAEALTENGFTVFQASTIAMAKLLMAGGTRTLDILVCEASLPDGDGRKFCASLRQQGCELPIILLSSLGHEADIVRGFEAGADDYLVKPFRFGELLARIRGQLRHRTSKSACG